jgi:hypothetical protein
LARLEALKAWEAVAVAIGRLSVKVGRPGRAAPHAQYIARTGQYERLLERENARDHGEALEATRSGNMPTWAQDNPALFWEAADAHERANGTTYREMELALPRELDAEQRQALVDAWVAQEIGDRHPYQYAIHCPKAADGGEQPHVHLMFSERRLDGIERDPEQFFKRANSKNPERGGCKKGWGERPGETLTRDERRDEIKRTRGRWENLCNQHLERAGHQERISMASHQARATGLEPERKLLPSQWRDEAQRSNVIDFRAARAARQASMAALEQAMPAGPGAQVILLASRRPQEQQAVAQALELARATGYERLSELAAVARQHNQEEHHGHQPGAGPGPGIGPAHRGPEIQLQLDRRTVERIRAGRDLAARLIDGPGAGTPGPAGLGAGDRVRGLSGLDLAALGGRGAPGGAARAGGGGLLQGPVPAHPRAGAGSNQAVRRPAAHRPDPAPDPAPGAPGLAGQAQAEAEAQRDRQEAREQARQARLEQAQEASQALEARIAALEQAQPQPQEPPQSPTRADRTQPPTQPQPSYAEQARRRLEALEALDQRDRLVERRQAEILQEKTDRLREAEREAEEALERLGKRPSGPFVGKRRREAWDQERRDREQALERAKYAYIDHVQGMDREQARRDREAAKTQALAEVERDEPELAELAREGERIKRDELAEQRAQSQARDQQRVQERAMKGPGKGRSR